MFSYFIGIPILFILLTIAMFMPFIFIVHDILRYGKWGWNKPDGFTWKGQVRFYIILTVIYYAIMSFLYFNAHKVFIVLFTIICILFYIAYVAEDSDNPNKKKDNEE